MTGICEEGHPVSSTFKRFAAVAAATAALPIVVIGATHGVAGAEPVASGGGSTAATYTGPPIPIPCDRRIEIGNRTMYEGTQSSTADSQYTYMTFSVTSGGCLREGGVEWMTFGGSASGVHDYVAASGSLRFGSGDADPRSVTIRIKKDGSPGPNENFYLVLINATDAIDVDDAVGTGTILNDDNLCTPPPGLPPGFPDYHCSE